jgi:hypothetical protein
MDPDSEELLKRMYGSGDESNVVGYTDPRIDELIGKIEAEMVTYARDAYLEEAWRIVTEDLVYLPIRHGVSVFAMRKNLEIPPDPWDVPRFRLARFTAPKVNRIACCSRPGALSVARRSEPLPFRPGMAGRRLPAYTSAANRLR